VSGLMGAVVMVVMAVMGIFLQFLELRWNMDLAAAAAGNFLLAIQNLM